MTTAGKQEQTKCCCGAEASEAELLQRLDDLLKDYRGKENVPLIPVLQMTQAMFGYLPEAALKKICLALNKSYSEVAGVVGFYAFFTTTPRGKHLIRVCLGIACYVRGGKRVLDEIRKRLHIEVGETTSDRLFTLEVARCFGACGLAPTMCIDDEVYKRVRAPKVGEILDLYRAPQPAVK